MAKYAQGYGRKNSDSKNLIIMFSVIIAVCALAVVIVMVCNKFPKKANKTYSDVDSKYYLTNYSELLDQDEDNYLIYVCSDGDVNQTVVLDYIEKNNEKDGALKLYLVKYSDIDSSSSDEKVTANVAAAKEELNYTIEAAGVLFYVEGNALINTATQIKTGDNVSAKLKDLASGKEW